MIEIARPHRSASSAWRPAAAFFALAALLWPARALAADNDFDGVDDAIDNCPGKMNPLQENSDTDMWGDACDNCTKIDNPGQQNSDGDQFGDACDNCPLLGNPGQPDTDMDGDGNACDNCMMVPNPGQEDADADGIGDACDLGAPCTQMFDCSAGACVDGICCNEACDGPCRSCKSIEKADQSPDGLCGPRPAGTTVKSECVGDASVSSLCDASGNVAPFVVEECGAFGCAAGICSISCDASGGCSDAAFCDTAGICQAMRADGEACDAPEQCLSAHCSSGLCSNNIVSAGCDADGHTLRLGDGSATDCSPYACKNAMCLLACGSIRDCAPSFLCDASGSCIAPPQIDSGELSCALPASPGDGINGRALLALGVSAAAFALRRRHSRRG